MPTSTSTSRPTAEKKPEPNQTEAPFMRTAKRMRASDYYLNLLKSFNIDYEVEGQGGEQ